MLCISILYDITVVHYNNNDLSSQKKVYTLLKKLNYQSKNSECGEYVVSTGGVSDE